MSAVMRRLPRLAGRGVAAITCAAMPAALAAPAAPRLAVRPLLAGASPFLLKQQRWSQLHQGSRWFSVAAYPEGAESESSAEAELEAASPEVSPEAGEPEEPAGSDAGFAQEGGYAQRRAPAPPKPTRVFVNNISWDTADEVLAEHFGQAGSVTSARIVRKRDTGQSQGFGFVEFESAEEASAAIERLHTSQLDGRELQVREDRGDKRQVRGPGRDGPREFRDGPRDFSQGYQNRAPRQGGYQSAPDTRVVVHGLPITDFQWQDFKDLAKRALEEGGGNTEGVMRADVRTHPDGTSRGWGILTMGTPADAQTVIEVLHGSSIDGRVVSAKMDEFARGREQGPRGGGYQEGGGDRREYGGGRREYGGGRREYGGGRRERDGGDY